MQCPLPESKGHVMPAQPAKLSEQPRIIRIIPIRHIVLLFEPVYNR
jgi:hypothetical protein